MTSPRRRRVPHALILVAVVVVGGVLSGCRQAPLDPGFRTPSASEPVPPTVARVDYLVPDGFVETYVYGTANHLYPVPTVEYLIPVDAVDDFANLDVISVLSYIMDIDVSEWSEQRLAAQVAEYATTVGEPAGDPVPTTVDGRPAFTLTIAEPGVDDPDVVYTYDATYIFAGAQLVQVQCQYDQRRELMREACATLVDSMKIIT
jgi:hypothetical protein